MRQRSIAILGIRACMACDGAARVSHKSKVKRSASVMRYSLETDIVIAVSQGEVGFESKQKHRPRCTYLDARVYTHRVARPRAPARAARRPRHRQDVA